MVLLLQLIGDWHRDNMATVTNVGKILSVEGKVKVTLQIINVKMQADLHRKFGTLQSKGRGKRDTQFSVHLNRT